MDVGTFLVTNTQSAKLVQPGKGAFHNPPPSTQSAAMLRVAHCEQWQNASVAQALPDRFCVVSTVANHISGPMTWAPAHAL